MEDTERATPVGPYVRHDGDGEAFWFLGSLLTTKATGAETRTGLAVIESLNPAGFAPPLHRHRREDEMFYVLSGTAQFQCDGETLAAGPGDFVLLPVGLPHTFIVGPEPFRTLQITVPSGFEEFVAEVGEPAPERSLPEPGPIDPAVLGHVAARHHIDVLGPPPR